MVCFIFKIKKDVFLIFLIALIVCSFSIPVEKSLYFSPNGDGDRDTILLSHSILKNPKVTSWAIKILQLNINKLKIIKTYDSKDYLGQRNVSWDGKQDLTSDKKEIDCSEGLYLYFVEATYEDGRTITTPFQKVFLDKNPSVNQVSIISDFFSPNGDGQKEKLELHLKLSYYGVFDKIKLIFLNEDKNRKMVNEISFKGKDFLKKNHQFNVFWDGKDKSGQLVEEGNYSVVLKGKDLANNKSISKKQFFKTFIKTPKISFENPLYFSKNKQEKKELPLVFNIQRESEKYLDYETISIVNQKIGVVVFSQKSATFKKSFVFKQASRLREGIYIANLKTFYKTGFRVKNQSSFIIDNTSPKIFVEKNRNAFAVSEDPTSQNKEEIIFTYKLIDKNPHFLKFRVLKDEPKKEKKKIVFSGEEWFEGDVISKAKTVIKESWHWNGYDQTGTKVKTGDYIYELKAVDKAGNEALVRTKAFRVYEEKAKGSIETKTKYVSPNGDNILDTLKLNFNFSKLSRQVFKSGKIVFYKKEEANKKKIVREEPVRNLLKKERTYFFKNKQFQDGEYGYDGNFWFDGDQELKFTGSFLIDTEKPKVTLSHDVTSFVTDKTSLTGNRSINFYQEIGDKTLQRIELKIFSSGKGKGKREVFLSKNYEVTPENEEFFKKEWSFNWAGLDGEGKSVAGGDYIYELKAVDKAGNEALVRTKAFRVYEEKAKGSIETKTKYVSPNGDNILDTLKLNFNFSKLSRQVFKSGKIVFYKKEEANKKKIVREEPVRNLLKKERTYFFKNKQFQDGEYGYDGNFWFDGDQELKFTGSFLIDTEKPKVTLSHDVTSFVTDKTSLTGNRSINFYQEIGDKTLQRIELKIFSSGKGKGKREVFLSKNHEVTPENEEFFKKEWSFNWAGLDGEGKSVAGGDYIYELKAIDKAGNEDLVRSKKFRVYAKKVNVSVSSELVNISPNGDGEKDNFTVYFDLPLETRKRFFKGFLKVFKGDEAIKTHTLKSNTESITYPNNTAPFLHEDGADYKYEYHLLFDGNENLKASRSFVVDTKPLELDFSFKNSLFSPNGDGFYEQFELDVAKEDFQEWRKGNAVWIEVKNQKGKTVTLEGMNFKLRKCVWKGRDENKKEVPEGTYFIRLMTKDGGNNIWSSKAIKVTLVRKNLGNLKLFFSEGKGFFNLEAEKKPIKLLSALNNFKYFQGIDYYFTFKNKQDRKIITNIISYKKPTPIILNEDLEKAFWREDNVYKIWAEAKYSHQINLVSKKIKLVVDTKPPIITLKTSDKFKPSAEVENLNELTIGVESEDNQSVGKTELLIYQNPGNFNFDKEETNKAKFLEGFNQDPLQVWEWEGSVLTNLLYVAWDDEKKSKNLKTGQEYAIVLKTTDAAGNVQLVSKRIKVGFLVETTQDGGLRIIINAVNFVFDSDEMIGNYQKTLTRILDVLVSFKGYNILIVGHTDSRGSDEYNQKLSEKRSKAVYNYFIKSGVDPKTLSSLGKGKTELLVKQEVIKRSRFSYTERKKLTELNYLKNRRVEFFLINEHKTNADIKEKDDFEKNKEKNEVIISN